MPNKKKPAQKSSDDGIRLNRYIALSGVCSRRKADELIKGGKIKMNGKVNADVSTKVGADDKVEYQGKILSPQRYVYVLLNKPKDFITTTKDERGRRTVMELLKGVAKKVNFPGQLRLYPVGRLDRNTTGLLLFTNDGELTEKLSHPRYEVKKIYHVWLDKPLTKNDFELIAQGFDLDDGPIHADEIAYPNKNDRTEVGIEIHSGRNRIVRRIFEHLGYEVVKLDRVIYAGLTKKDLPRGRWRLLSDREVVQLKHFNTGKK